MDTKTNQSGEVAAELDASHQDDVQWQQQSSKIVRFYSHPWTQIILISVICFCLPGVRISTLPTVITCGYTDEE